MPELTPNEAAQRRTVVVMHPFTDAKKEYKGDEVYSVNSLGIVISVSRIKMFYPWHRVTSFTYDIADTSARYAVQGF